MKKGIVFLFLLVLSGKLFSQEPAIEMNDGAIDIATSEVILKKQLLENQLNQKLIYSKTQTIYYSSNDQKLQSVLLNSRDHKIVDLVEKAKKNRKHEFIGFAAIPLGITAAYCINRNVPTFQSLKPIGVACLLASLSCIIISPIATHQKTANYKKAVKLYNLKF